MLLVASLLLAGPGAGACQSAAPAVETEGDGRIVVRRGEGRLAIGIPADEVLGMRILVGVGALPDVGVGDLTLSAGTEPWPPDRTPPGAGSPGAGPRAGWIRTHVYGDYLAYELDHTIELRIEPRDAGPRFVYRDTQSGTENRRRELEYGTRAGRLVSTFRADGHCSEPGCARARHLVGGGLFSGRRHCAGCRRAEHRVWRAATERELPAGAVDFLSAVYLARAMVRAGTAEVSVPLVDQERVWKLHLERGAPRTVETRAGKFRCIELVTLVEAPAGEPGSDSEFTGLFGIGGALHIWLEARTGVPIRIEGEVPVGLVELRARLDLARYSGTPADFAPVE